MTDSRGMDEVLYADTPEGKRSKWAYIKSLPEMEEVVLAVLDMLDSAEAEDLPVVFEYRPERDVGRVHKSTQ